MRTAHSEGHAMDVLGHLRTLFRDERGNLLVDAMGMTAILAIATLAMASLFSGMSQASASSYRKAVVQSELSSQIQRSQMASVADAAISTSVTLPSGSKATIWRADSPLPNASLDRSAATKAPTASGVMSSYVNGVAPLTSTATCTNTNYTSKDCLRVSHLVLTTLGGVQVVELTRAGIATSLPYTEPFVAAAASQPSISNSAGINRVYELPAGTTQYNYYLRYDDLLGSSCKPTVLAGLYTSKTSTSFPRAALVDVQVEAVPKSAVRTKGDLYGSVNLEPSDQTRYVGVGLICEGTTNVPKVSQSFVYAVKGA